MSEPKDLHDLEKLLAAVQLPALPQSAVRLMELSQDPTNGPAQFANPIEADPGLMIQVLRFVNSSYFGFSKEIASIQQAIALVGVRTIKNFVLWSAVFSLVPNPKFGTFDLKKLWQDSLRRALFARNIGRRLRLVNAEDLFAAALLQDMAIPLLLKELPLAYEPIMERRSRENVRLSKLERETFGWDHAQAAAALVRFWRLPEEFAVLIERHPDLNDLLLAIPPRMDAACVAIASLLPACKDEDWREAEAFHRGFARVAPGWDFELPDIFFEVDREYGDFAPFLNLPDPKLSLIDCIKLSVAV